MQFNQEQHPGYTFSPVVVEAMARVLDTMTMGTPIPGMEQMSVRQLRNELDQVRAQQDQQRQQAAAAQAQAAAQQPGVESLDEPRPREQRPTVAPMPKKH